MTSFTSCAVTGAVCSFVLFCLFFFLKEINTFLRVLGFANLVFDKMETLAESEGEPTFGNFLSHRILFSLWIIAQKFKRSLCANKNPSLSEHDWLGMLALFLILLLKLGIILLFSLSCFHRRWSGSLRRGRSHPPTAPWTDGLLWGGGCGAGQPPLPGHSSGQTSLTLFDFSSVDPGLYKQPFMAFASQRGSRVWMGTVTKSHLWGLSALLQETGA